MHSSTGNILGTNPRPSSAAAVSVKPLSQHPGSVVPASLAGRVRSPILFLIDVSGSTGAGVNPDLPQIERMLADVVELLRQPPAHNPLSTSASVVDIAIVTYANEPRLVQPWEQANRLPPVPALAAGGGTNTATALLSALDYVARRLRYYDAYQPQPIPKAVPHIFHLTDGAPIDIAPGDAMWQAVQELLAQVSGDKDKPYSMISHFVAPNGTVPGHTHLADAAGNAISGYDAMSRWTGSDSVFALTDARDKFDNLTRVILKSVGASSQQRGRINDLVQRYNAITLAGSAFAPARKSVAGQL